MLEAVNIKKSLIITGMTNWDWIKFGVSFLLVFPTGFTAKTGGCFGYYPGVWTLAMPLSASKTPNVLGRLVNLKTKMSSGNVQRWQWCEWDQVNVSTVISHHQLRTTITHPAAQNYQFITASEMKMTPWNSRIPACCQTRGGNQPSKKQALHQPMNIHLYGTHTILIVFRTDSL